MILGKFEAGPQYGEFQKIIHFSAKDCADSMLFDIFYSYKPNIEWQLD